MGILKRCSSLMAGYLATHQITSKCGPSGQISFNVLFRTLAGDPDGKKNLNSETYANAIVEYLNSKTPGQRVAALNVENTRLWITLADYLLGSKEDAGDPRPKEGDHPQRNRIFGAMVKGMTLEQVREVRTSDNPQEPQGAFAEKVAEWIKAKKLTTDSKGRIQISAAQKPQEVPHIPR